MEVLFFLNFSGECNKDHHSLFKRQKYFNFKSIGLFQNPQHKMYNRRSHLYPAWMEGVELLSISSLFFIFYFTFHFPLTAKYSSFCRYTYNPHTHTIRRCIFYVKMLIYFRSSPIFLFVINECLPIKWDLRFLLATANCT